MLLNFVGTQSAAKMNKEKKKLDAERRAFLKSKNESAYSESVMKMIQLREATQMKLMHEVCEAVEISETDFMMSLETHA